MRRPPVPEQPLAGAMLTQGEAARLDYRRHSGRLFVARAVRCVVTHQLEQVGGDDPVLEAPEGTPPSDNNPQQVRESCVTDRSEGAPSALPPGSSSSAI